MKMFKKFNVVTVIVLLMVLIINFNKPVFASTTQWYTSTTYSNNSNVKVTIDNPSKLTNKQVTITVDSANYNNGDNVIVYNPGDNNFIVTYGSKFTVEATEKGYYTFAVERKDYYDPKYGDPNTIWCGAYINNIDKEAPVITFVKTYVDNFTRVEQLKFNVLDNTGIYRVKLPDSSYDDGLCYTNGENTRMTKNYGSIDVYKNGKYTVEAEDPAGNKTITTFTVTNCNPMPLKIDKVTVNSNYITGKTLPNSQLVIKTDDYSYYADNIKADKNGYYKAKLPKKLKLNKMIIVRAMDSNTKSKYSSNKVQVKVVDK